MRKRAHLDTTTIMRACKPVPLPSKIKRTNERIHTCTRKTRHRAHCARSKWKYWPKVGNGPDDGWKKNCNRRPTSTAGFFPLSGRKARHRRKKVMHLRSVNGVVELKVWQGQDGKKGPWGCPIKERWRLRPHQQMSPALEEKLAFTATATRSYEEASQLTAQWDCPVDDSVIHSLVQRLGQKAEEKTQLRLNQIPQERQPQRAAADLAVLMNDGWMARFRGPGWGKKQTKKDRVEWHEIKTGVFYRHEQLAHSESGRGLISEKVVVRWQGEPLEFGRRLGWEAVRGGLGRAQQTLALSDGGKWIWKMVEDRWSHAIRLLDFYHASEHLWNLGRAYVRGDEGAAQAWVEPRLHQLRHGQEETVLAEIAALKVPRGAAGQTVRQEKNYFAGQSGRMNYKGIADRGWPIGSGAVESACRQSQCRFKCAGQFWTQLGFRHLSALDEARRNHHWDELWLAA